MKFEDLEKLEIELENLCNNYKISEEKKPFLEFFSEADKYVGSFDKRWNTIWIFDGLDLKEALQTLRHEFGHFLLWLRDPKRKFHKGEERIANMMERTLLRFPHLLKTSQQPLEKFMEGGGS